MGFKQIADLDCENTTAIGGTNKETGKKNPTTITGYYVGSRTVVGKKGESLLHVFQTEKGNLGVWGKTNLDAKLRAVAPGSKTRVTFVGMVETKNNPMYKYKVEVDSEDTIDVGELSAASEAAADDSSDDSDAADHSYQADEYDSDPEAEEDASDEVPYTPPRAPAKKAAAPSASAQSKVRELLGRSK